LRAFERLLVAADHDGERAVPRAFRAAADGSIEEMSAGIAQAMSRGACRVGADRGAVDDDGIALDRRQQFTDDREHIRIGGHARHDDVAQGSEFDGLSYSPTAGFLREGRCFLSGAIPDRGQQAVLVKVARHAQAHRAQADESSPQCH
jgi:hypothetical protein